MTDKEGTYKTMQGCVRGSKEDALTRIPFIMMCACAAFCEALGDEKAGGEVCACRDVVRPQWGGGIDHPHEVQQKRTHTQILYSPSLFSHFLLSNPETVYSSVFMCVISAHDLCFFAAPPGY